MTDFRRAHDETSWGRIKRCSHEVALPRFPDELPEIVTSENEPLLAVGFRRSYGDSCLNDGHRLIDMTGVDRVRAFDWETGIVRCDAGISIDALLRIALPRGWFVPTTPGTRFVTLGGAVANDIHGKNHHRAGSFGCSVRALSLLRTDRTRHVVRLGDSLFAASVGGLGLTGVITEVELGLVRIESAYLDVERLAFSELAEFFALAAESSASHEHTVAWVDCTGAGSGVGRGIFQRANWCHDGEYRPHSTGRWSVPIDLPTGILNRSTLRTFNAAYRLVHKCGRRRQRVHYASFFYPLDALNNWNRIYGRPGFYQYQCVVPAAAYGAISELLDVVARSGDGSFLAVLKTLGPKQSGGLLSFPMEGATLALDFPNRGAATLALMSRLDEIVVMAKGRLYPAKDSRMTARLFAAGFPRYPEFARLKDPGIDSDFWRRVSGA